MIRQRVDERTHDKHRRHVADKVGEHGRHGGEGGHLIEMQVTYRPHKVRREQGMLRAGDDDE